MGITLESFHGCNCFIHFCNNYQAKLHQSCYKVTWQESLLDAESLPDDIALCYDTKTQTTLPIFVRLHLCCAIVSLK